MSADLAPDDQTIAFDILGAVYIVNADGGRARQLSPPDAFDSRPKFSPSGKLIAFISDGGTGTQNLWVSSADGSDRRQLSHFGAPVVSYDWEPNGKSLIVSAIFGRDSSLFRVSLENGTITPLAENVEYSDSFGVVDLSVNPATGDLYATLVSQLPTALPKMDRSTDIAAVRFPSAKPSFDKLVQGFRPIWMPDGRSFIFARRNKSKSDLYVTRGRNQSPRFIATIDTPSLGDSSKGALSDETLPSLAVASDGKSLVTADGGRLARIDIETGHRQMIPMVAPVEKSIARPLSEPISLTPNHPQQLLWPTVDTRGQAAFSAGGNLWLSDRAGKARMVGSADRYFAPAVIGNGSRIAAIKAADTGELSLAIMDGRGTEIASVPGNGKYLSVPRWSEDGSKVAILKFAEQPAKVGVFSTKLPAELVTIDQFSRQTKVTSLGELPWTTEIVDFRRDGSARLSAFDGDSVTGLVVDPEGETSSTRHPLLPRNGSVSAKVIRSSDQVEDALLSPDLQWVALVARDAVFVTPAQLLEARRDLGQILDHPATRRLGFSGSQLRWEDDESLVWTAGDILYRWKLGAEVRSQRLTFPKVFNKLTRDMVLLNANLVTATEPFFLPNAMLIIRDGRIIFRGKMGDMAPPANAEILDLNGAYVMPGLIDTHSHTIFHNHSRHGAYYSSDDPTLDASLNWGVTTLYDPQADARDIFYQRDMIERGNLRGPRIYSAGVKIEGAINNGGWARDIDDLKWIIAQRELAGTQFVKAYEIARRDWRQAIVSDAHKRGLRVSAEGAGWFDSQITHVFDGVDGIEHAIGVPRLHDDVAQLLAAVGNSYTPLIATCSFGDHSNAALYYSRITSSERAYFSQFATERELLLYDQGPQVLDEDGEDNILDIARSAVSVASAGGLVTAGSHGEQHGIAVHWELWALVNGGMAPENAIRAGTINGAKKLGLNSDLGSIEVGKVADLVVVNANPLSDIRQTANIRYVIKGGVVETRPETFKVKWPN
jgi:imidazolonepropionase-like amidohydrolase/dipeptidyl aminopeptidase/acylaminoacyl peptidase